MMTTAAATTSYVRSARSVDTEGVVITQDSIDTTGASTTGLLLSQDTIASKDVDDSQERDSNDASSKGLRQLVSPVCPQNEADEAVDPTLQQQPPLPPRLIVLCPNVNDVLFPMEGFTMWPGNTYCNSILQQYQANFKASSQKKAGQAQILLEMIHLIQTQQQYASGANDDGSGSSGCGRFLKAIKVPYRKNKRNQNSSCKHINDAPPSVSVENDDKSGDTTMPTRTIWEVMYESDVLIEFSKIFDTEHEKREVAVNEESQIPVSSMAILEGLYYVPNYYPSGGTEPRPHEYGSGNGSGDDESVVSYYSSSSEEEDDNYGNQPLRIKRRRVIHRTVDDYVSNTAGKTSSNHTSSKMEHRTHSSTTSNATDNARPQQQHSPPIKVSMIGRIIVDEENRNSVPHPSSSSSATANKHSSSTNGDHHGPKVNFQYKPKSLKSHQAMFEQEGLDCLPKGVTVRPSGKWVRRPLYPSFGDLFHHCL